MRVSRAALSMMATSAIALGAIAACSTFGADGSNEVPIAEGGAMTMLDGSTIEGSAPEEAGPPVDTTDSGTQCAVFVGSNAAGFSSIGSAGNGTVKKTAAGLVVDVDGDGTAGWRRALDVGTATSVKLRFAGILDAPDGFGDDTNAWYADLGKVVHGPLGSERSSPGVNLVLTNYQGTSAGLFTNVFASGTVGEGVSARFAHVGPNKTMFEISLDVTWSSTVPPASVTATLDDAEAEVIDNSRVTLPMGPTTATTWSVVLGGNASASPQLTITYTTLCVETH